MPKGMISEAKARELVGLSKPLFQREVEAGNIPYKVIGKAKRRYFATSAIEAYLNGAKPAEGGVAPKESPKAVASEKRFTDATAEAKAVEAENRLKEAELSRNIIDNHWSRVEKLAQGEEKLQKDQGDLNNQRNELYIEVEAVSGEIVDTLGILYHDTIMLAMLEDEINARESTQSPQRLAEVMRIEGEVMTMYRRLKGTLRGMLDWDKTQGINKPFVQELMDTLEGLANSKEKGGEIQHLKEIEE